MIENKFDKTDNGGSAFPVMGQFLTKDESGPVIQFQKGMSLRDYFAGQAVAGYCSSQEFAHTPYEIIAEMSYMQSDAILAERNKK